MSQRRKWRIYYVDSTFSDYEGEPEDAPSFGVVAIPCSDEDTGRRIVHGFDWYVWQLDSECWWGCDIHGLLDMFLHNAPIGAVKQGRSVSNEDFKRIYAVALNDPDFPQKSAMRKGASPVIG